VRGDCRSADAGEAESRPTTLELAPTIETFAIDEGDRLAAVKHDPVAGLVAGEVTRVTRCIASSGQDGQLGQVVLGDHPYVCVISGPSTHYLLLLFLYFYLTHLTRRTKVRRSSQLDG
jgi:hypothetical protein